MLYLNSWLEKWMLEVRKAGHQLMEVKKIRNKKNLSELQENVFPTVVK